jgi:hypothetical protein
MIDLYLDGLRGASKTAPVKSKAAGKKSGVGTVAKLAIKK